MRLADFIEANAAQIIEGAVDFARTQAPAGVALDTDALRDHIPSILAAFVRDLRTAQSAGQQRAKAEGRALPAEGGESAASNHGRRRARDGFDVNHMVAEYRALRAAVLRLWAADEALSHDSIEDMIRFNEAIDQAVAESLADFTDEVESWRALFLGVLGHDLRGPLSAIVCTSDLLSRATEGTAWHELSGRIADGGMRMGRLLDDLLDYNRVQLGKGMVLDVSPCDLRQALEEEITLLHAALPDTNIQYRVEGPTKGWFDASRVRQVLHNLVTNAAKYSDPGGQIAVSLVGDAAGVALSVSNPSAAIEPGTLDALFDPLRRGSISARRGEKASLGLGLFVVREIARAHGGEATASSADGQTRFTVLLPAKAAQ